LMVWAYVFPGWFGFVLLLYAMMIMSLPLRSTLRSWVVMIIFVTGFVIVELIHAIPQSPLYNQVCWSCATTVLEPTPL